ncbi:F0F1 ATP synthase subunit gamma [Hyphococcus luteus]|uniref:F0F1 ATP synthase subunit gamma n=1 Tax=Hyphococcus luteus TaxID=2058213 RepID=A0A2S7KAT3_9PROT|nr:FoF1 ATP synthase subunit gamma [Marinicaulis flavus]PQA89568.1 F0F1 ATP synthase subunit gamma [Marinicaulis flavus]
MEQLVRREKTGRDLQSIVGVMKSLSAVAIKHYDEGAAALLHYRGVVDAGLQAVLRQAKLTPRAEPVRGRAAYIVIGSDRGLCGRFNETVVEAAAAKLAEAEEREEETLVLTIGARAEARLDSYGTPSGYTMPLPGAVEAVGESVESILLWLDDNREKAGLGSVTVFYNQRTEEKLAATQEDVILPVTQDYLEKLKQKPWPSHSLPAFTVDADDLFSRLIREHMFLSLARGLIESLASEHASRLAAMQRAERHIDDYLATLTADIRHERQSAITQQLLDIVGSYNVMKEREEAGAAEQD